MHAQPGCLSWAALIIGWITWGINLLAWHDFVLAAISATAVTVVLGIGGLRTGD